MVKRQIIYIESSIQRLVLPMERTLLAWDRGGNPLSTNKTVRGRALLLLLVKAVFLGVVDVGIKGELLFIVLIED